MNNEIFMLAAIDEAKKAMEMGEVPVGAVVTRNGKIIASAYNTHENGGGATAHAELKAIEKACQLLGGWRLSGCELYVTLEPCPMCMGASLNARVDKLYFGAYEQKGRSLTTELADANLLNHKTEVVGGVLQEECAALLSGFFIAMRQKQKADKERAKAEAAAENLPTENAEIPPTENLEEKES